MNKEIYPGEIPENLQKEISFLYDIGVDMEELVYLLTLKMIKKA